jgi:hypothetical protein
MGQHLAGHAHATQGWENEHPDCRKDTTIEWPYCTFNPNFLAMFPEQPLDKLQWPILYIHAFCQRQEERSICLYAA